MVATTEYYHFKVFVGFDLAKAFALKSKAFNPSRNLVFLVENHRFGFSQHRD